VNLIYGTAWKEAETARLVSLALEAGFRAIDTANQRKHYFEAAVGDAVHRSGIARSELFLQTKFTFRGGQDQRLPYDAGAAVATQVEQSFQSSLEHLQTEYVDSYVLHGPWGRGWSPEDEEAWGAMEALHASGRAKSLGVSNVSVDQLEALCRSARVQPQWVQNRCYARMGWDADVREACTKRGIRYQGFSLLTANPHAVDDAAPIAKRHHVTAQQVIFAFALAVGMVPLTGTTSVEHMRQDLAAVSLELTPHELKVLAEGP
jgi:diketogulonate reductase-like aldo/keto reductase